MAAVGIAQSPDETADLAMLRRVAAAFGLGDPVEVQVVAEGLMNSNWRMITAAGCFAVKQIRDVGPDAARRQHQVAAMLAAMGLPVPAPLTTRDGDTIAMVDDGWFSVVGWVSGAHRGGVDLAPAQLRFLGALLGKLHNALAAIMPSAPEHIVAPVTDVNTARKRIERYERCVAASATPDAFDLFVAVELRARHALLRQVAHLSPTADAPVLPVGWTHSDFQHLHWASPLSELPLSVQKMAVRWGCRTPS